MEPVKLFNNQPVLKCANCDKDLFENPSDSIIVFIKNLESISNIYYCCKGD